jgi:GNAT superfamily N-acetyltransferase
MIFEVNNRKVNIRKLEISDFDTLIHYFQNLSESTKKRFEPHVFDKQTLFDLYASPGDFIGFIAIETDTGIIVAYTIIKTGHLQHDSIRLQSYGLIPDHDTDCTFAPSVADLWQSSGLGSAMFGYIIQYLKATGIIRIILWGGVQSNNEKAINFYKKHGFRSLGHFEYQGWNEDMVLDLFHTQ